MRATEEIMSISIGPSSSQAKALQHLLLGAHSEGTREQRAALRRWLMSQPLIKSNSDTAINAANSAVNLDLDPWPEGLTKSLITKGEALTGTLFLQGITWITCIDADYPNRLFLLPDYPLALFVEGDRALLKGLKVSVVGTRQPSYDGEAMCRMLGAYLRGCNVTAVSGLAFGIDAAIHKGMLRYGGSTIAVLPSGLRAITPTSHLKLAGEILASGGLLLSERMPEDFPLKNHYLERNRIIAALSEKVVIVESGVKGGSLNTAMHALQLGCEVYAMPGAIRNPVAVGTNRLIRDGALPLLEPEDLGYIKHSNGGARQVIDAVGSLEGVKAMALPEGIRGRLLAVLGEGGVWQPDFLAERLDKPVFELLPELMALVLDGRAEQMGDGYRLC